MKVLLINPSWEHYVSRKGRRINRAWPPLDLLYCAALLERQGITVDILDARAEWITQQEIAQRSQSYDKIFITSSPLDRWQCPNLEIELFFKFIEALPRHNLYIMGVHGTQHPNHVLERTQAQAIIRGEPEWAVMEICQNKSFSEILGLTYRQGTQIQSNSPRPLINLNELPIPAFYLLNFDKYHYELVGERFVLLEATRGCPFPCTFCMREMYGGRAYRTKTVAQIGQEVESALAAGAQTGYFIDLEFTLKRDFTWQTCQELMQFQPRWKWCCQTRADSVDKELLSAMKAAGCTLIHFGVETGSAHIMKTIDKRITLEQIQQGVTWAREVGIETACFFMMGFPGETDADRKKTLEFAKKLDPTYASFHIASPYPGTPLYESKPQNLLYPESLLEGQELARLKQWEKTIYRRYYLRPGYVMSALRRGSFEHLLKQARLLWQLV